METRQRMTEEMDGDLFTFRQSQCLYIDLKNHKNFYSFFKVKICVNRSVSYRKRSANKRIESVEKDNDSDDADNQS